MRLLLSISLMLYPMISGLALQPPLHKMEEDAELGDDDDYTCSQLDHRISRYVAAGAVFVHIPKAGGTSVENALLGLVPCSEGKDEYGDCGSIHGTANGFLACNDTLFKSAPSFAILREPLSRARSIYQYALNGGNGKPKDLEKYGWVSEIATKYGMRAGFEVFLEKLAREGHQVLNPIGQRQVEFVLSSSGDEHDANVDIDNLVVDQLLCLERLDEDWAGLQQKILALQTVKLPPPTRTSGEVKELDEPSPRMLELMSDPFYAADMRLWQKHCGVSSLATVLRSGSAPAPSPLLFFGGVAAVAYAFACACTVGVF